MGKIVAILALAALTGCGATKPKPRLSDLRDSLNDGAPVRIARFRVASTIRRALADGRYETLVKLKADSADTVPELSILARSSNGARISDIELSGVNPESSLVGKRVSGDTERGLDAINVPAEGIAARIITEGDPGSVAVRVGPVERRD